MSGTALKDNDYRKSTGRIVSRLGFKPNSVRQNEICKSTRS